MAQLQAATPSSDIGLLTPLASHSSYLNYQSQSGSPPCLCWTVEGVNSFYGVQGTCNTIKQWMSLRSITFHLFSCQILVEVRGHEQGRVDGASNRQERLVPKCTSVQLLKSIQQHFSFFSHHQRRLQSRCSNTNAVGTELSAAGQMQSKKVLLKRGTYFPNLNPSLRADISPQVLLILAEGPCRGMDRDTDFSHSRRALKVTMLMEIWGIKNKIPALPTEYFWVEQSQTAVHAPYIVTE